MEVLAWGARAAGRSEEFCAQLRQDSGEIMVKHVEKQDPQKAIRQPSRSLRGLRDPGSQRRSYDICRSICLMETRNNIMITIET